MPKKLNTQNFIEKSKIVHNDKYDYSLVEYKGAHSKVKIICPIHGEFEQQAYSHLQGYGCKKCSDDERRNNKWLDEFNKIHNNKYDYSLVEYKNTHSKIKIICPVHGIFEQYFQSHFDSGCNKCKRQENFINNSKKKHGDKYDYSLVDYVDKYTKVKIICPEHGEFIQTPLHHIRGCGCKLCADDSKRWDKEKFIEKSIKIHGNKYDYSLVEYKQSHEKVKIICPIHGEFIQKPYLHINSGNGCPLCGGKIKTYDRLLEKFNEIHNNKYKYDEFVYNDYYEIINIICPIHGKFQQKISIHINGNGCQECGKGIKIIEEFIEDSIKKHGDKYDYSLVEYYTLKDKVRIVCPIHGVFEQSANGHLQGYGCNMCNESKGEIKIRMFLNNKNIKYVREKTFDGCKNKQVLQFDFYLQDHNICIEFDGRQHYESIEYFGGEESFKNIIKNDNIKDKYCKDSNIKLIRIRYDESIEDKLKILFW